MSETNDISVEDPEWRSWKQLLKDPRVWVIILLTVTMSASVTSQIEKYTGLRFNKSKAQLTNSCVARALYSEELTSTERLAAAKVCVAKPEEGT